MLRYLVFLLVTTAGLLAQDLARMAVVADAQAAGGQFMGSVLVGRDGKVLFEKSYGLANVEWAVPNDAATKYRIGSVTKQFTAAAILLLEERGKLKLDDPVSNYIPSAPATWEKITLLHLLTHTSGLVNFTDDPRYAEWKRNPSSPSENLARIRDKPLQFEPGTKWAYSNTGYLLLSQVVETTSGQPFAQFVSENLLRPLGMTDSGFDSNTEIIPHRAYGYVGSPGRLSNAPYIDMTLPRGAGGLYSTTHDLMCWTEGVFGGKLLAAASLEKMTRAFKNDYALGVSVKESHGRKRIEHGGGIDGFNSHVAYFPESRTTVVVLANLATPRAAEFGHQLASAAFGEPVVLPSERKEIQVPEEVLRSYVGTYQLRPKFAIWIRFADGHLTSQASGQTTLPLFAESSTRFFLKAVDAQIEFTQGADGKVDGLILHQNGRSPKAPRVSDTVPEKKAIELPRALKEACIGVYELKPGFDLTITLEGDQLMSQATGQGKAPIYPESETRFFPTIVDATIDFTKNEKGEVTGLVLRQGPAELPGRKK